MSLVPPASVTITLPEDVSGATASGQFPITFDQPDRSFAGTVTFDDGNSTVDSSLVFQFGDLVKPTVVASVITEDRANDYEITFGEPYFSHSNIWYVDWTAKVL